MTTEKPQTLAEMQRMSTDDFHEIEDYHYHGNLSKTRVIGHLVDLAAAELSWQGRDDAGSLRDFWYNPTKSVLESAFPNWGDGAGTSDWNREMSKRLSEVISDKVKDGELTYRDLNILDDSRDRRIASSDIDNDKILFVEKSAAYRKLKPLAKVYDITLVEGSGWQATALIEDLVHQLDTDQTYTFWVLGDYDPTGFGIVDDFVQRAGEMGLPVDEEASRRIGIWPRQVPDDTIEAQKFTPGGSNNQQWLDEHGIDGKYGLEIEAIGEELEGKAEALREVVVEEIKDDISADDRRFQDTLNSAARVPQGAASGVVRSITSDLKEALAEAACDIYEQQDGVAQATQNIGANCMVRLDRDVVMDGDQGDMVPEPYPESRLHSGAVSGNKPSASGRRKGTSRLKDELQERIEAGEIDVAELLGV